MRSRINVIFRCCLHGTRRQLSLWSCCIAAALENIIVVTLRRLTQQCNSAVRGWCVDITYTVCDGCNLCNSSPTSRFIPASRNGLDPPTPSEHRKWTDVYGKCCVDCDAGVSTNLRLVHRMECSLYAQSHVHITYWNRLKDWKKDRTGLRCCGGNRTTTVLWALQSHH